MTCAKETDQKSPGKQDFCKTQMAMVSFRIPYFKMCQLGLQNRDPEGKLRITAAECQCYCCLDSQMCCVRVDLKCS